MKSLFFRFVLGTLIGGILYAPVAVFSVYYYDSTVDSTTTEILAQQGYFLFALIGLGIGGVVGGLAGLLYSTRIFSVVISITLTGAAGILLVSDEWSRLSASDFKVLAITMLLINSAGGALIGWAVWKVGRSLEGERRQEEDRRKRGRRPLHYRDVPVRFARQHEKMIIGQEAAQSTASDIQPSLFDLDIFEAKRTRAEKATVEIKTPFTVNYQYMPTAPDRLARSLFHQSLLPSAIQAKRQRESRPAPQAKTTMDAAV